MHKVSSQSPSTALCGEGEKREGAFSNRQYDQLCADLRHAGVHAGMVLVVHSSFRSLGFAGGSPEQVIRAFQQVLTDQGTLLMPALSWATVTRDRPFFSVRDTPCCVGVIPETFRKMPNVVRSVNPVHSVCAWGKYADVLTRDHCLDMITLGEHSPYRLLPRYGGKILMLGCGLAPNTCMHAVENAAHAPYRATRWEVEYQMTDANGREYTFRGALPDMGAYVQRYDRIADLLSEPDLRECDILHAHSYLIDAAALFDRGTAAIRQNPYYFVDAR